LSGQQVHSFSLCVRIQILFFIFCQGGDVEVSAMRLREGKARGKGMAFVRGEMLTSNDGQTATSATFAFGAPRVDSTFNVSLVPPPPSHLLEPDKCPSLFEVQEFRPNFTHNFEARLAQGAPAVASAPLSNTDHFIWVRHIGCDEITGGVDGMRATLTHPAY
jgi:hypothetical protein